LQDVKPRLCQRAFLVADYLPTVLDLRSAAIWLQVGSGSVLITLP
jgi:hypothetical protein